MKKECDNFPELNHVICKLDASEASTASYFESHGMQVERLCAAKAEGKTPDFRITDDKGLVCLCEVKTPSSSTGALTEVDWKRVNRIEFEQSVAEAKRQNAKLIVTPEELKLARGEIPYPEGGRNTDTQERENARKIEDWLRESSAGKLPLEVMIYRSDPFHWSDEEIRGFVIDLAEKLLIINEGQIPRSWHNDFGIITGHYSRAREHGRYIQNQIQVKRAERNLVVNTQFNLGVNWEAIEGNCRQAQRQIRSRLEHEAEQAKVVRVAVVFLDMSLFFMYASDLAKLASEIDRRVIAKFPELSAVAFCEKFDPSALSYAQFLVFHTSSNDILHLPRRAFDDGCSLQFPF